MFAELLNGLKGNASAGAMGAGGQGVLSGPGTAMGGNSMSEFGTGASLGGAAKGGIEQLMGKLQGLTPEQQLQIATQMAQFAAPPPMAPMTPQGGGQAPQFSQFMNPAGGQPAPMPQLRTPLGMGG